MSLSIPRDEPNKFTSGDYVQWSKSLSDFPSTSYRLTYQFRGPKEFQTNAANYQTNDFLITLPTSETANIEEGKYSIAAYVTDYATGQLRYSVRPRFPYLEVKPDPSNYAQGAVTNLSWAAKTLPVVEDTITKLTSRQVSTASVNGQSYSIQNINELVKLRNRLREEIRSEQDAINVAAGLGAKKNILVRFPYVNTGGCDSNIPGMTYPWDMS